MATVNYYVNPKKKANDTWKVSIMVCHKRRNKHIPTSHYLGRKQLRQVDKGFIIKDDFILEQINKDLKKYRKKISALQNIDSYTCEELRDYLTKDDEKKVQVIDFIKYARSFIEKIKVKGTRDNGFTTLNSFIDFVGPSIDINEITLGTLKKYDEYLRTERKVERITHPDKDKPTKLTLKPATDTGVKDYMVKLHSYFKEAMKEYNDRGHIVIPYDPFEKYDFPKAKPTKKRNLEIEVIRAIRDCKDIAINGTHGINRANFAKDVAMLSFYLVGMNAVDLYNVNEYVDGRISYNRAKTSSRRDDSAYISIKVEPEALPLLEKYKDPSGNRVFCFYKMYSHHDGLTDAVNTGLKKVFEELKADKLIDFADESKISLYYLRYSWSNIARNDCHVPKDDVSEALNHSDPDHKTTDIYLEKVWTRIDNANRKVIDYLNADLEQKKPD